MENRALLTFKVAVLDEAGNVTAQPHLVVYCQVGPSPLVVYCQVGPSSLVVYCQVRPSPLVIWSPGGLVGKPACQCAGALARTALVFNRTVAGSQRGSRRPVRQGSVVELLSELIVGLAAEVWTLPP